MRGGEGVWRSQEAVGKGIIGCTALVVAFRRRDKGVWYGHSTGNRHHTSTLEQILMVVF